MVNDKEQKNAPGKHDQAEHGSWAAGKTPEALQRRDAIVEQFARAHQERYGYDRNKDKWSDVVKRYGKEGKDDIQRIRDAVATQYGKNLTYGHIGELAQLRSDLNDAIMSDDTRIENAKPTGKGGYFDIKDAPALKDDIEKILKAADIFMGQTGKYNNSEDIPDAAKQLRNSADWLHNTGEYAKEKSMNLIVSTINIIKKNAPGKHDQAEHGSWAANGGSSGWNSAFRPQVPPAGSQNMRDMKMPEARKLLEQCQQYVKDNTITGVSQYARLGGFGDRISGSSMGYNPVTGGYEGTPVEFKIEEQIGKNGESELHFTLDDGSGHPISGSADWGHYTGIENGRFKGQAATVEGVSDTGEHNVSFSYNGSRGMRFSIAPNMDDEIRALKNKIGTIQRAHGAGMSTGTHDGDVTRIGRPDYDPNAKWTPGR